MDTITSIGYGAELLAKGIVISKGYVTSTPDVPSTEYDFIIESDSNFYKVQVKGSYPRNDGRLKVDVRRSKAKTRVYDGLSFDILLIVDMKNHKAAFLDYHSLGCPQSVTLRVFEPVSKGYGKHSPKLFSDHADLSRVIEDIQHRKVSGIVV